MKMIDTVFYYTGLIVWCLIVIFCGWFIYSLCVITYKRHIKQTIGNIRFILFGSKKIKSYHEQWKKYDKPGIRKFWQTRKYFRRCAWRSLVKRAYKETHSKKSKI